MTWQRSLTARPSNGRPDSTPAPWPRQTFLRSTGLRCDSTSCAVLGYTLTMELPTLPAQPQTPPPKTEVGSYFVANYPPFSVWSPDHRPAIEAALDRPAELAGKARLGLYLHIPFCRKRCRFCYFRVYTDKN